MTDSDTIIQLNKKLKSVIKERDETLKYLKATAGIVDILLVKINTFENRIATLEAMPHNQWKADD
jgi:hypothetical protein